MGFFINEMGTEAIINATKQLKALFKYSFDRANYLYAFKATLVS